MISSFHEAMEHFIFTMRGRVLNIIHGPSAIIQANGKTYMVQFKRNYYKSFSVHFPQFREYGYGQVMSIGLLERAIISGIDQIVFITPDRNIYSCYPMQFKRFYEKYHTDVPHLDGEIAMPLKFFKRLGK